MANDKLIEIEDLTKVFYTDEVETHRSPAFTSPSRAASMWPCPVLRGAASPRCYRFWAFLTRPTGGRYLLNNNPVENLSFRRSLPHPQPGDRLHFPELQSYRRPDGGRECGTAPDLSRRYALGGAQGPREGSAGARKYGASHEALSGPALRRSTAACGCGPRTGWFALDSAG